MKNQLFLILFSAFTLMACNKEAKVTDVPPAAQDSVRTAYDSITSTTLPADNALRLETFGFPAEVSGCSCYFAASKQDFKNRKYVYIDDYGNSAYLNIEGKQVKIKMNEGDFDPQNFSKSIHNEEYKVRITGKKIRELEEVMMFEGSMTVENKKGQKTTVPIYGECGC